MVDEQGLDHLVSSQPQITLSQYEYRVSRLPVRRHPRRKKRQYQHQAPLGEHSDDLILIAVSSSPYLATTRVENNQPAHGLSSTTPAGQPEIELSEHNEHVPMRHAVPAHTQNECHSLPSADTIPEYDSNSNLDNTSTAPTAHMYLDDDGDQALLRDADACDSDVSPANPDDEEDKHDFDYVSPISTQEDNSAHTSRKRKALKDVDPNSTESPTRKKSSRTKKKSKPSSTFEAVLASNQLIMVSNDSFEGGSFHVPYLHILHRITLTFHRKTHTHHPTRMTSRSRRCTSVTHPENHRRQQGLP